MPPINIGRTYSFATANGKLIGEVVESSSDWIMVRLRKGDRAWLRPTSITSVVEMGCAK